MLPGAPRLHPQPRQRGSCQSASTWPMSRPLCLLAKVGPSPLCLSPPLTTASGASMLLQARGAPPRPQWSGGGSTS
eukprot:6415777-Lingulodinium_polyedra.AAC.1